MKDEDGRPHIEIACHSFSPHNLTGEEQTAIKESLLKVLAEVVARVLFIEDPEQFFTRLFRDDLASQRALDFTTSFVVVGNVLGHEPRTTLETWVESQQAYLLSRSEPWDKEDRLLASTSTPESHTRAFADHSAEPPPDLLDLNRIAHNQIMTVSLIRENLWKQAGWIGTGFAVAPGRYAPPIIALMFRESKVAERIFSFWRTELGEIDENDRLRLAIVRGISKTHPYMYRVIVGSNIFSNFNHQEKNQFLISVSKYMTMEPSSDGNLKMFLASYNVHGRYILTHGSAVGSNVKLNSKDCIIKNLLVVREAWEIGLNDADRIAVHGDDDPIIPGEQKDAPVLKLLDKRRSQPRA